MAIKFSCVTKHGRHTFMPDVALAFEDPDAEPYFKAAGWAADTSDEPVLTYSQDEIDIDPGTVFGDGPNKGNLVVEG